jgi:hypothetical protein
MGQLVGVLGILCQDPDSATQHSSLEGVGHLYQLLTNQKGEHPQPPWLPQPQAWVELHQHP